MPSNLCLVNYLLAVSLLTPAFSEPPDSRNAAIEWTDAALRGIRDSNAGAPVAARALATMTTCMYDSWSAYSDHSISIELRDALRRPPAERTDENKEKAVSYAAYQALMDLLPVDADTVYRPLMKKLGYDPDNRSVDIETPVGIAHVACGAVLEFRHHDGSNQLGDLAQGAYSDWTQYKSLNLPLAVENVKPLSVSNLEHWQPLSYVDSAGDLETQRFATPQWCYVAPFALKKGDQFRAAMHRFGPASKDSPEFQEQAKELVTLSAGLTDRQKSIAEYWEDGGHTEQPPGHWFRLAARVSARDKHTLDEDVKMFFALGNAELDASIASWDIKRAFDSVRPITAIRVLFGGQDIRAWGGPGKATVTIDGCRWMPYQPPTRPTPPFPEFVSGHSTYSAAAAEILLLWTGSDRFDESVTLAAGFSKIEPGITPKSPVTLYWRTFTEAADEAGMSRRYGGIHFKAGDLAGRVLGRLVAAQVWEKAREYFDGTARPAPIMPPSPALMTLR